MFFASHLARTDDMAAAVDEAADAIDAELDGEADVIFAFARAQDPNDYRRVPELLRARFTRAILFGCSAAGVIGDGQEEEDAPALALTAARLPGAKLRLVHVDPDDILVEQKDGKVIDPGRLRDVLELEGTSPDAIMLVDPFTLEPDAFASAMDVVLPRSVKLGALASAGPVPKSTMLYGDIAFRRGAVVLLVDGAVSLRALVAQGCRPIGTPHVVTKLQDDALLELDGKPALDVLQATFQGLSTEDRDIFRHSLFVGIEMDKQTLEVRTDRLLVRQMIGVDPSSRAISVAAPLKHLDVLHFVLRDSASASLELVTLLNATADAGARPEGVLLFSCLGRGRHLFGSVDHDPKLVKAVFGELAIGGFFTSGELAPVGPHTYLHAYTSAFAFFEKRSD